jgi:serine/threonine-protein kinase ULK/ATG1
MDPLKLSNASSGEQQPPPPPADASPSAAPAPPQATKVVSGYSLISKLGSGSFATVYLGAHHADKSNPPAVAIKAISVDRLTRKVRENLDGEISILKNFQHTNVVRLLSLEKTQRHVYLVLEFCGGGDLQKLIRSRKTGRLTERLTRRLMADLASGLQFLNQK